MTAKFLPTVLHGQDWTYIRLSGVIDEDNRLQSLMSEMRGALLLIDLIDVERINSCGVRDWVAWLDEATRLVPQTVLLDCAPSIVAQLNLVGNFCARATVRSIVAPYYCETCDRERTLVVDAADLAHATRPSAPILTCETCGGTCVFDDIEESFFGFLAAVEVTPNSAQIENAIANARDMLGEPSSPRIRVIDDAPTRFEMEPPPDLPVAEPSLSQSDMVFYLAVGVLSAILLMVIYQIAVP